MGDTDWISDNNIQQRVSERRTECEVIAECLRLHGFDVSWERVNRHYRVCHRWYYGLLSTGFMVKQTGFREGTNAVNRNTARG